MKRFRRVGMILGIVLVVILGLYVGGRRVLASHRVANEVASKIADVYGAPVQIRQIDVGLGSTSLQGLELYEDSEGATPGAVWAAVDSVGTDVSPLDVVQGKTMPHRLSLHGAQVTLRFDKDGHLLTRFPKSKSSGGGGSYPDITMDNSQITVHQEGRPEFHLQGLKASTHSEDDQLVLSGEVDDPEWGRWTIAGRVDPKKGDGSFNLKTERVHATAAKLQSIPFVSPTVWKEVQPDGNTSAELNILFGDVHGGLHYEVTVHPQDATIRVPVADVAAEHARGEIVVKDGVLHLRDVQGSIFGGEVKTTSDMDLTVTPEKMHLVVSVSNLDLDRLPASWPVPRQLGTSKLSGQVEGGVDLTVTLGEGDVHVSGGGKGRIVHPHLGGVDLGGQPIEFSITANGTHFQYSTGQTTGQASGAPSWRASGRQPDVGIVERLVVPRRPYGPTLAENETSTLANLLVLTQQSSPFPDIADLASQAVRFLERGVSGVTNLLRETSKQVAAYLPGQPRAPKPPGQPPNYVELNLGLQDVDLAQLLKGLQLQLPYEITGRLTFQMHASLPADSMGDLKSYRLDGKASLSRLSVNGLDVEQVRAQVTLANGVMKLDELSGQVPTEVAGTPPGSFSGTASLQVAPAGDFNARLTLNAISMARVLKVVPNMAETVSGLVNGNIEVRAPFNNLGDLSTWTGTGTVTSARVASFGMALEQIDIRLGLERGVARLTQVRASLQGASLRGTADLNLTGPYAYHARVDLEPMDLAALQRLAPDVRLPIAVTGRVQAGANVEGNLTPFAVQLTGDAGATDLAVEHVKFDTLTLHWSTHGNQLTLRDVRAKIAGGEITGSGEIPLRANQAGNVDVRFHDVDVGVLTKSIPKMPIALEGKATGTVTGKLTPTRDFSGKLSLEAPRLRVQGIPADRLTGDVEYKEGAVDYRLEGETLGGKFQLNGKMPSAAPQPAGPPPEGRLQLQGARLSLLGSALNNRALQPLSGVLDLDLRFRHQGPGFLPVGSGQVVLRGLGWGNTLLSDSLRGEVILNERELRLRELVGSFAGGVLRVQLGYNIQQPQRSGFSITLQGADAAQVFAPFPGMAGRMNGPLDAMVRGRIGREWVGGGEILLARGRLMGVDVHDWRMSLDFAFAPRYGNAHIEIRDSSGQLAQGRVTGQASMRLGMTSQLDGQLRLSQVDLATLLREAADFHHGSGKLSGQIDFTGSDVQSVNDLNATIRATLGQAQATNLPVFQALTPSLMPGFGGSLIQSGNLQARLANGVVRVQRLELSGSLARLFAFGNVSLGGNLDLHVTASTGNIGPGPVLTRLLGLSLPAIGPIPLGLVSTLAGGLSSRMVNLDVTGTIKHPVIRVQPFPMAGQELFRFLLLGAI